MKCIVSIIGRQNVGKSTLFNKILGKRTSIVHKTGGITRDRIYGDLVWNGFNFFIIDTGGYSDNYNSYSTFDKILNKEINYQILKSINESDIILFIIDIRVGILSSDIKISSLIRKQNKPIFLVINKVDHGKLLYISDTEFFKLGFENYYYVSSTNGSGVAELLDDIVIFLLKKNKKRILISYEKIPNISVIGRQNVGKSTLINSLLGKYQNIVTNYSGTTRDVININYKKIGYECVLNDTPGLKKKSKIKDNIDFYSMSRTTKTIENTDICLFMIDSSIGLGKQDIDIFRMIEKNQKGVIILVNKWDFYYKKNNLFLLQKNYENYIKKKIFPFWDIPIIFISAKKKYKINNIIPTAFKIEKLKKNRLKTNILNKIMLPIFKKHPPSSINKNKKKKFITIKYCTQLPSYKPKFVFFSNYPKYINKSYERFVENNIRMNFCFYGVPIKIFFRKK